MAPTRKVQKRIQKPKAKQQVRQKQQGKPNVTRTVNTGLPGMQKMLGKSHHFNAFGAPAPQALAFSVGAATHICGVKRWPIATQPTTSDYLLVAFQPGGFNQLLYSSRNTSTGVWTPSFQTISSVGIDGFGPTASNPDTIMCTRGSIRLRNVTAAGAVQGVVHVMKAFTGLPDFFNNPTETDEIVNLILEDARTTTYSASELTASYQWDSIPTSQDKYHAFQAPRAANAQALLDPGLSTTLILIESVGANNTPQDYELSLAATYFARYNKTGPLANMAKQPPTAPLNVINMM